jgi:hypothetical protein
MGLFRQLGVELLIGFLFERDAGARSSIHGHLCGVLGLVLCG